MFVIFIKSFSISICSGLDKHLFPYFAKPRTLAATKKDFTLLRIFSIYWTVLFIALASCNSSTNPDTSNSSKTFTNIDSALKYCTEIKEYKSLLFALVSKDIENSQKLGWTILGDNDIIKTAKKNYVLIIIDPTKIVLPANSDTKEFQDIIKSKKESPFFVVTNHVFYPFRQFTLKTDKDIIIDNLNIGEGP